MLRFPRAMWIAVALAIALTAPSLFATLYCDDLLFVTRLDGTFPSPKPGPFSLYELALGGPENRTPFWWTHPELHLKFLRPLASGLFALDHALWNRTAWPYHVHSLAWFGASVALASALYRRLLGPREGAFASILFALAPTHALAAAWPSARHVAIAGAFSFAALLLHLRARERGRFPFASVVLVALAMATGEVSLGVLAYVFAYEAFGREEGIGARVKAFAPYAVLAAAYVVVYRLGNYGAHHSGNYADPMSDPAAFVGNLPAHIGPLMTSTFLGIPADASVAFPALVVPTLLVGTVLTLVFAWLLRGAVGHVDAAVQRTMRWLVIGAILACAPGMAGIVGDRAIFLPSLGFAAAMSLALLHGARAVDGKRSMVARGLVLLFGLLQCVLAPLGLFVQTASFAKSSRAAEKVIASSEIPRTPGTHVFGVGIGDPLIGMYLGPGLAVARGSALRVDLLSVSFHDHAIRRLGERVIEVEVLDGALLEHGFETVVRPKSAPLERGDFIENDGFRIQIQDATGGRVKRFAVTFDRSVDDPQIALIVWKDGALRRVAAPEIGDTLTIRHEVGPVGF